MVTVPGSLLLQGLPEQELRLFHLSPFPASS